MTLREGILGHEKQLSLLERGIAGGKIPHAYLFWGPPGIGKGLVALRLAQALQCQATEARPCGRCGGCRKSAEGNHPDVLRIEPDGNFIKIEQIRELQKRLGLKPFEGRGTVSIIDGADRMNLPAANALLKTLEEPPQAAYLILLAENIRQVIPTIISRCQRLMFNPLPLSDIAELLVRERGIAREEALTAARIGEGSLGKAVTFLESFPRQEQEALISRVTAFSAVDEVFTAAEELAQKEGGDRLMTALEVIKFFLRDTVLVKLGMAKERLIGIAAPGTTEKESKNYTLRELLDMIDCVSRTESAILMNANRRLAVENLLLKFYRD